ncbi:hypothetical protein E5Q_02451 [Mixia osmundae IAM 14324]|uniref:Uncharacterized protein n=1 Tax=Mixia osmundae (strain CBS 9802 / IAM 14324 / JCM 22182 / KY 12970) TaxID=764103 RepID=G7DYY4_MIXOS|nr:hypothetical protein E5Q_02451 [Mixia osmundae IAM 14324]
MSSSLDQSELTSTSSVLLDRPEHCSSGQQENDYLVWSAEQHSTSFRTVTVEIMTHFVPAEPICSPDHAPTARRADSLADAECCSAFLILRSRADSIADYASDFEACKKIAPVGLPRITDCDFDPVMFEEFQGRRKSVQIQKVASM